MHYQPAGARSAGRNSAVGAANCVLRLAARPEHCQKRAATIASNCVFVNLYLFGPVHTLYCKVCRGDHFYPKITCPINFFSIHLVRFCHM